MNSNALRFVLPSLLGVLIFLTPIHWDGNLTIGIGVVTGWVKTLMGGYGLHFVVSLTVVTSSMTLLGSVLRPAWMQKHESLKTLFDVPVVWIALRVAGMCFALFYFFGFGPRLLQSEDVGGAVFVGIGVEIAAIYISACLLLPLLTDFGLMEFVGTLARPLFQKVFQLPGRAAIDAVASFVGASSIGLLITIGQYDRGNYTQREASVIAMNFSIISIPFSLAVANVAGIGHLFIPWYLVVVLICLIAAFVTPRLPPLSRKAEIYRVERSEATGTPGNDNPAIANDAWQQALDRASRSPNLQQFLANGISNLMFFLFSVITASMALATVAAMLVFHTPVFEWFGYPFIALLEVAQLPDAAVASKALFSGFLDQFMPALAAADIQSDATSFVLAGLAVCPLIYMSEIGVIVLRSSLPVSLADLVVIFLLRTAIALPVLIVAAHIIAG